MLSYEVKLHVCCPLSQVFLTGWIKGCYVHRLRGNSWVVMHCVASDHFETLVEMQYATLEKRTSFNVVL